MNLIAFAAVMLVLALPLPAVEMKGRTATISEEELAACAAEGGCMWMSRAKLNELRKEAAQAAAEKIKERGDPAECWQRS